MNARKPGFTLIEMLVATVLAGIVMAAIYQTLVVQQRGARRLGVIVNTTQTVRTGMQFLQSELREVGSAAGDVEEAASDHIKIRALRKVGLICGTPTDATHAKVYTFGNSFQPNDTVAIHADQADTDPTNDQVIGGVVTQVDMGVAGSCTGTTGAPWTNMNTQASRITLSMFGTGSLAQVSPGAAIRSYVHVTYGVYAKGSRYVFGRRDAVSADTVATLMGPLAPGGLVFSYFDTNNNALTGNPLSAAQRATIGRVRVTLVGLTPGYNEATGASYTASLVSDAFLRGN